MRRQNQGCGSMFIIYGSRSGSSISKKFKSWILWLRMRRFQKNVKPCFLYVFCILNSEQRILLLRKKVKNMKKIIFNDVFPYTFFKIESNFNTWIRIRILNSDQPLWIEHTAKTKYRSFEISKKIFPEKEYRGLSPNFQIHASVSDLYIPTIGLPLPILLEEICGPILGLYKSLTDT